MLFTLQNRQVRVCITPYGARMVSIETLDRCNAAGHILLGFDDVAGYVKAGGSFGAVLGRYANRICNARFTLDGRIFELAGNDHGNILHGGDGGFGNVDWQVDAVSEHELALSLVSPDGNQGFPGTLTAQAVYRLEDDCLSLSLFATTDAPTVVNLSSHPYFNLGGVGARDILDHEITIDADYFLPTDAAQIPTGEMQPVAGTAFDFRQPKSIGQDICCADPQLLVARGYDHCFVLNKAPGGKVQFAARAFHLGTGRGVEIYTDQPGLQLYSGNSLDGAIVGRGGVTYRQSGGFAFEAQNFPDAPNRSNFGSTVLRPGQIYQRTIVYKFLTA